MTITKVKYEKLFPAGAYLNEKIGFEAEIHSGYYDGNMKVELGPEDPKEAIEQLRQLAEEIHKEKYPHFYDQEGRVCGSGIPGLVVSDENFNTTFPQESSQKENSQEQGMLEIIKQCDSVGKLLKFEPKVNEAQSWPVRLAFDKKLKQLEELSK